MNAAEICMSVFHIENRALAEKVGRAMEIRDVDKGEILVRVGEMQKQIYFLLEGVFRGFFLDMNGKEHTDCIGVKCGATMMSSFGLEKPAQINVEMLTKGKVVGISVKELEMLMSEHIELLIIYNQLLTESLAYHWEIKMLMYQYTAQQRYEWFIQKYPSLVEKVSNKYIASFLSMNPVTLSRLRTSCGTERSVDGGGK